MMIKDHWGMLRLTFWIRIILYFPDSCLLLTLRESGERILAIFFQDLLNIEGQCWYMRSKICVNKERPWGANPRIAKCEYPKNISWKRHDSINPFDCYIPENRNSISIRGIKRNIPEMLYLFRLPCLTYSWNFIIINSVIFPQCC